MSAMGLGTSSDVSSITASYGKWRQFSFFQASNPEAPVARAADAKAADAADKVEADFAGVRGGREKKEKEGREAGLDQALANANEWMESNHRSIRFRFHQDLGRMQVQVLDPNLNRVIRSVPADEILHFNRRMRELSGLGAMVDESR